MKCSKCESETFSHCQKCKWRVCRTHGILPAPKVKP